MQLAGAAYNSDILPAETMPAATSTVPDGSAEVISSPASFCNSQGVCRCGACLLSSHVQVDVTDKNTDDGISTRRHFLPPSPVSEGADNQGKDDKVIAWLCCCTRHAPCCRPADTLLPSC